MSTMAGRRNPIRKGSINYGNFSSTNDFEQNKPKGTKPTAEQETVVDTLIQVGVDLCKLYLLNKIKYRIYIYLGILFGVSIIGDVLPYPKSYFSQSGHFLNQYFVKLGWGWTLICTIPFVVMTSYTYCCSNRQRVILHLTRLGIATFFWLFWTNTFQYIESIYGRCTDTKYSRRSKCLQAGLRWSGFDISGHSFILIYSVLLMIEEAKPIQGWLMINTGLNTEEHSRSLNEKSGKFFQNLTEEEIKVTKENYRGFRRPVCFNFLGITLLCLIWDFMLVTTAMYYHTMLEKFVSGLVAIFTWYATYYVWYSIAGIPPLPCAGRFKYYEQRKSAEASNGSFVSSNGVGKGRK